MRPSRYEHLDATGRRRLTTAHGSLKILNTYRSVFQDADYAAIFLAVYIGHMQQRPMDITAVAMATQLPRTTVLRKLKEFSSNGLITMQKVKNRKVPIINDGDVIVDRLSEMQLLMAQEIKFLAAMTEMESKTESGSDKNPVASHPIFGESLGIAIGRGRW